MPQTSVSQYMSKAYAGQIAEPGAPKYCATFFAEAAVSAGMPVKRGTDKESQCEPFEAGDTPSAAMFAGVVVLSTSRPHSESGEIDAGKSCSVMRLGVVNMDFSEAVTAGEQVGLTLASGVLTGIPHGTAAGSIAAGIVVLPGLRIAETTGAAGLARVEVNLFGSQDAATVGSAE